MALAPAALATPVSVPSGLATATQQPWPAAQHINPVALAAFSALQEQQQSVLPQPMLSQQQALAAAAAQEQMRQQQAMLAALQQQQAILQQQMMAALQGNGLAGQKPQHPPP